MSLMKRFLGLGFASILACSAMAETEQPQHDKNMSITVDALGILGGQLPLNFNVGVTNWMSLGVSGFGKFFSFGGLRTLGGGAGANAKFYLSGNAFTDSWYVNPQMLVGYYVVGKDPETVKAWSYEPSVTGGYDWVWASGFTISLGLGVKYAYISMDTSKISSTIPKYGFQGFMLDGDFTLGWAF